MRWTAWPFTSTKPTPSRRFRTAAPVIYTGKITNWRELGGKDGRIVVYGRENSSGTYQFFKEHVLKNQDFARDVQTLPGTGAIVNAVSKDPASIGYGGIAYASGIRVFPVKRDEKSEPVSAHRLIQ